MVKKAYMHLVYNHNANIISRTVLLFLILIAINTLQAQNKIALLVGISDYPEYPREDASWSKIHGANDVRLISPLLADQGFSITTLINESATHEAILNSFKTLENNAHPGDIVYIHLSGHGQAVEDEDGDEADGWDEAFIPYDAERSYREEGYHGENHLLDDELNVYLNSIRRKVGETGIVYVVIDACHAGSSYRGEEEEDIVFIRGTDIGFSKTGKSYTPRINRSGNILITSEDGMSPIYMLEACRSYQVNIEIKQNGTFYGPLSYYIGLQLLTKPLSFDTNWIGEVRTCMENDIRLRIPRQQDMVIESSK